MKKNLKLLKFDQEARQKIAVGAQKLTDAVTSTLGPRSRNVILESEYGLPRVLHDGVSIAKEIELEDPFEDMGAKLILDAASKTNDMAGDGTTTATLLANTLFQNGLKLVEKGIVDGVISPRISPMELQEKLTEYGEIIVKKLDEMKVEVKNTASLAQIATISAASEELGQLIAEAVEKVGKDGLVMIEENVKTDKSSVEYQEGMEFSNGYLSPYFVTNSDRMEAVYSGEHYVLLTDYAIADAMQLVDIIEKVIQDGGNKKALLVIADDVTGPALQALVLTKIRSGFPVVAVMAPEYADRRKEMLEDLAVLTGGVVISKDKGDNLKEVKLSQLGKLSNIKVTATHTALTPLHPDSEEIAERAAAVKEQIKVEQNEFRKGRLQERLAKLTQGVAIIQVAAPSELELKNKKERVIDAVHATKAAIAEGIVPGGGVALRDVATQLYKQGKTVDPILNLIVDALEAPYDKLLKNAGIELASGTGFTVGCGINVVTKKTVDMVKEGVIDPVKVTKMAITQAISVAGIALTTAAIVVNKPEEDKK